MDISSSVWRGRAKVVAILDIVISCLSLLASIFLAVMTSIAAHILANKEKDAESTKEEPEKSMTLTLILVWVFTVISAIFTVISVWASIKLKKASEMDRKPEEADKMAKIYRNVNIIFFIMGIIGNLATGNIISLVIHFLMRVIFLFVAHKFIMELQGMIPSTVPEGNTEKV